MQLHYYNFKKEIEFNNKKQLCLKICCKNKEACLVYSKISTNETAIRLARVYSAIKK